MSHVVEEDAIGGDEVVLDLGQVQRELQDPIAITLLCWVYRSSPYSTRAELYQAVQSRCGKISFSHYKVPQPCIKSPHRVMPPEYALL